jgi:hypothetical protein
MQYAPIGGDWQNRALPLRPLLKQFREGQQLDSLVKNRDQHFGKIIGLLWTYDQRLIALRIEVLFRRPVKSIHYERALCLVVPSPIRPQFELD